VEEPTIDGDDPLLFDPETLEDEASP